MDTQESPEPNESTGEAPAALEAASPPPPTAPEPVTPPPAPPAPAARTSRSWPASTVIAAGIALALFAGLIGGVIGFSIANHHNDRVGLVGYQRGLEQGQLGQQGPFSRNPDLQQRLQQFRDNHPGMRDYFQGNPQGGVQGYSQPTPGTAG